MRTIMVELFDDGLSLSNDTLGRAGEKNVVQFSVNFDALRYTGLTTATLLYKPRNSPVLAMPSVDIPATGRLISQVPDWAMSMFGVTQVQLQLTGEGVETRSYIWHMRVERSLINYGDKPTPLQDWLQEVREAIDDAASLTGFKVIDYFDTYDELIAAITAPVPGAAYGVGTAAPYDVYVYGETSGWTNIGPIAVGGGGGESIVFVPSISEDGLLTWENNGDLPNPAPINIKGPKGDNGGAIYTPNVSEDGLLWWTNNAGLHNPDPVNIKGEDGFSPSISVKSVAGGNEMTITHQNRQEVVLIPNGSAPYVQVEDIDGGHRVTFYGGNGPKSIDVLDGASADENRFSAAEERLAALEQDASETDGRITVLEEGAAENDDRVSVLEQDMAEVKKITDNFDLFVPKFANTAEGEMLVLTDSAEGALQGLKVYGRTTQATTTGANLIKFPYVSVSKTEHGLTYTINKDGSVGIKGTATQAGQFVLVATGTTFAALGIYDTVTLSCVTRGTLGFVFDDGTSINIDPSTPRATITPNDKTFRIRWLSKAGVTYDETIYPMLNMGSVALPWEPYTGGIPSPNPDYPQPLNSVGDDGAVDVTVAGKNLLDMSAHDFYVDGMLKIPYSSTNDATAGFNMIRVVRGQRYTLSYKRIEPTGDRVVLNFYNRNGEKINDVDVGWGVYLAAYNGVYGAVGNGASFTIPQDSNVAYLHIRMCRMSACGEGGYNYYYDVQLEVGSVATAYEPYKPAQTLTLSTPNGLPSVGDVCDEVDLERGVHVQRIGRIASYAGESVGNVWMSTTGDLTTGATIIYPLATHIETPLSDEIIAAFRALKTHYPTTTIYNDESANMAVKYAADTKNYIDQKLATLAAAMVINL